MGTSTINMFVKENEVFVDFINKEREYELRFNTFEDACQFTDQFQEAIKEKNENGTWLKKKKTFLNMAESNVCVNFDLDSYEGWQSKFSLDSKEKAKNFYEDMTEAIFGNPAL